jgi:hypothetical protein
MVLQRYNWNVLAEKLERLWFQSLRKGEAEKGRTGIPACPG